MALHRRQVLALLATGVAPALAGCSPCGETWTGVGFRVEPTAIERTDGWRVDARLSVNFNFGREGNGIETPALALFGGDGALLSEAPVDNLRWSDVPDEKRESDDCGDYATVAREATLESDRFPRWVALRFDEYRTGFDEPTAVARYPDRTPPDEVSSLDYESVDFESVEPPSKTVEAGETIRDVRFTRRSRTCEDRETTAEARTNVRLRVRGERTVPAERYHPVLSEINTNEGRLTATIGLQAVPRFRRADCLRVPWSASIEVTNAEAMPSAVELRMLDTDDEVTKTGIIEIESGIPES